MKRLIAAAALLVALVACDDPADSAECRDWQKRTLTMRAAWVDDDMADLLMAEDQPEGCPWPQT